MQDLNPFYWAMRKWAMRQGAERDACAADAMRCAFVALLECGDVLHRVQSETNATPDAVKQSTRDRARALSLMLEDLARGITL